MSATNYNAKGIEVKDAFVQMNNHISTSAPTQFFEVTNENRRAEITFAPSKDFWFDISKDEDCNIDIYLHVNPKHLIAAVPQVLSAAKRVVTM
jgi:hypothetical protein